MVFAGCTDNLPDSDTDDSMGGGTPGGSPTSSETNENDGSRKSDHEIVEYQDLSERGKHFVDSAFDENHDVQWISGEEKTYIKYDDDQEQWVRNDDPLTLESVDDNLEDVFGAKAYLEYNGRYYEGRLYIGDSPYKVKYEVTEEETCKEIIDESELSENSQEIIQTLRDKGTVWVADKEFEKVAEVDNFWANQSNREEFSEKVARPDNRCIEQDERFYRVDWSRQRSLGH